MSGAFFGNYYFICACADGALRCDDSHADTWPQSLQLVPTEADMPMQDLQPWLKRVQPALCMFQLQNAASSEPKGNEQYYRALVGMLTTRKQVCTFHRFFITARADKSKFVVRDRSVDAPVRRALTECAHLRSQRRGPRNEHRRRFAPALRFGVQLPRYRRQSDVCDCEEVFRADPSRSACESDLCQHLRRTDGWRHDC